MKLHGRLIFVSLGGSIVLLIVGLAARWSGDAALGDAVLLTGTIPAVVLLVFSFVQAAQRREIGVDVLALSSIAGAVALDQQLTAIVVAIMFVGGQALEAYSRLRAGKEMTALLSRTPRHAYRLNDEAVVKVPIESVCRGDHLLVRSGDVVPVDGALQSDAAALDESALTGESIPVERRRSDMILSGSVNAGVGRKVIMSHFAQSKSEPLFRTVEPFCAKADHASEGSVDDQPCAHFPGTVAARDRASPWHLPQHGGTLRSQRRRPAL